MRNGAKRKAKQFIKEFRFYAITLDSLKTIIEKQGYTIVEFNSAYNSEHTDTLIKTLKLENRIIQSRGFSYADNSFRLVFVDESLTDEEKLIVLAHEEGHIYCKHLSRSSVIGEDVLDECEANEFSHYILEPTIARWLRGYTSQHKKTVIVVSLIVLIAILGIIAGVIKKKESSYYGNYYVTETGRKYHIEGCSYIKDKTNIHRMTIEEYESGKYEPCGKCLQGVNENSTESSGQ